MRGFTCTARECSINALLALFCVQVYLGPLFTYLNLGFGVYTLRFKARSLGLRAQGSICRAPRFGFRVGGLRSLYQAFLLCWESLAHSIRPYGSCLKEGDHNKCAQIFFIRIMETPQRGTPKLANPSHYDFSQGRWVFSLLA